MKMSQFNNNNLQLCSPSPPLKVVPTLVNLACDFVNRSKYVYTNYINFVVVDKITYEFNGRMDKLGLFVNIIERLDCNLSKWCSMLECYFKDWNPSGKITIRLTMDMFIQLHGFFFFADWCKLKDHALIFRNIRRKCGYMAFIGASSFYWKYPIFELFSVHDDERYFDDDFTVVGKLALLPISPSNPCELYNHRTIYHNAMILSIGCFHGTKDISKRKYYVKLFGYYLQQNYIESQGTHCYVDVKFMEFLIKSRLIPYLRRFYERDFMFMIEYVLRDVSDQILLCGDVETNPGPVQSTLYSFNQKLKDVYLNRKFEIQSGITSMFKDLISIPTKFHFVFDKLDNIIDSAHTFLMQSANHAIFEQFSSVLNLVHHSMTLINIVLSIVVLGCLIYFKEIIVIPSLILLVAYVFGWDRKLIILVKELINTPVIQDASFALVGQVVFAVIAFVGTGMVPGVSYLRKLDLVPKAFVAGTKMYEAAGETINKVIYYYRKYFLKWSDEQLNNEYGILQEVRDWEDRVAYFMSLDVSKTLAKEPEQVREIEELYHKMHRWLSRPKDYGVMPRECQQIIIVRKKQLEDLYKKVAASNAIFGGPRDTPLTVLFSGESGVGKTQLCYPLAFELMCARGITRNYLNEIYCRNVESEFWDNYCNQSVVFVDDAFQMRDSVGKPNPEIFEAIRMSNTAPYQPHMADLSDKGRYFTSDIVIYTTNLNGEAESKIHSIHSAQAAIRRLTQNAFEVDIDPAFLYKRPCYEKTQEDGTVVWDENIDGCVQCDHNIENKSIRVSLCAIAKCKSSGKCFERDQKFGFTNNFCPHIYRFNRYDFATGKIISTPYDWDGLLKYVCAFDKYLTDNNKSNMETLRASADYYQKLAKERLAVQSDDVFYDAEATVVPPPIPIGVVEVTDPLDALYIHLLDEFCKKHGFNNTRNACFEQYLLDFPELWTMYNRIISYGVNDEEDTNMSLIDDYENGRFIKYEMSRKLDLFTVRQNFSRLYDYVTDKVRSAFEYCQTNKIILWAISILSVISSILGIVAFFKSGKTERRLRRSHGMFDSDIKNPKYEVEYCLICDPQNVYCSIDKKDVSMAYSGAHYCENCAVMQKYHQSVMDDPDEEKEESDYLADPTYFEKYDPKRHNVENSSGDFIPRQKVVNVENSSGEFVVRAKVPKVENSSGDFVPKMRKVAVENSSDDFIVRCKPPTVEDSTLQVQAVYDQTMYDLSQSVVRKNMYRMNLVFEDGYVPVGNVLFISGTTMLMPYHYYLKIKVEKRPFVITLRNSSGVIFKLDRKYLCEVTQLKRAGELIDACLCVIDPKKSQIMIHQRIINNFICDADLTSLHGSNFRGSLSLLAERPSPNLVAETAMIVTDARLQLKNIDKNPLSMDAYGDVVHAADYWIYSADTKNGDCGGPLFIAHKHVMRKLVGIHQSGYHGVGISVVITQEMLNSNLTVQSYVELENAVEYLSPDNRNENLCDGLAFYGKIPRGVVGATTTAIRPSPLFDKLPRTTIPAKLFYSGVGNPMGKGLEKFASETPLVDSTLIEFCRSFVRDQMNVGIVKKDRMEYARILTNEEAVKGVYKKIIVDGIEYEIPDKYLAPINRKTSPGYPYCQQYPGKNKHFWFGESEWELETHRAKDVLKDVDKLVQDAKIGKVGPVFWIDTLKDERRTIEKVAQNKTRVFCAGSQQFIIAFRKYTLGMSAWTMHNRLFNGVATGVNVYSNEWDLIVRLLHAKGKNIIAGDFSNFDGTMNPQIMWVIAEEMLYFYRNENCDGKCGNENCIFCNEKHEDHIAFMTMFVHIINALHINGDNVWQAIKSQPSGNPLTAVFNSYYQMMLFSLCYFLLLREQIQEGWREIGYEFDDKLEFADFLELVPQFIKKYQIVPIRLQRLLKLLNMNSFKDLIKIITYGDDGLISVHDSILDFFNQTTVTRAMKILGHDYTDECKSGKMYISRPINEVNFLKRQFVFRNVSYDAPLSLDTILDIVQFTKKGVMSEAIFVSNIDVAMRELSLHDKDVFEHWKNEIKQELVKLKLNIPLLTYEEYRIVVLNNALFVESDDVSVVSSNKGMFYDENADIHVKYTKKSQFLFNLTSVLMLCESVCLNTSTYVFDFSIYNFNMKQRHLILSQRQNLRCSFSIKF